MWQFGKKSVPIILIAGLAVACSSNGTKSATPPDSTGPGATGVASSGGAEASAPAANPTSSSIDSAPDYPNRAVHIIIPNPAGSAIDLSARAIGQCLSTSLHQPFVVENQPGGSGAVGMLAIAKAKPDGYTLGSMAGANTIIPPLKDSSVGFKPSDFVPIGLEGEAPVVLLVQPDSPYQTASAFFAATKTKSLSIAQTGATSVPGIVLENFISQYKLNVKSVPFNGNGQAMQALLGGHVDAAFMAYDGGVVAPQIAAGKVKAIATAAADQVSYLPDVPTLSSLGYPNLPYGTSFWYMGAPKDTPPGVVGKLTQAMKPCMTSDAVVKAIGTNIDPDTFVDGAAVQKLLDDAEAAYSATIKS